MISGAALLSNLSLRRRATVPFYRLSSFTALREAPAASRFCAISAFWAEAAGSGAASHTRPVSLQGELLRVAASSSSWAQQMTLCRHQVAQRLNGLLGEPVVRGIRFFPSHLPEVMRGGAAPPSPPHPSALPPAAAFGSAKTPASNPLSAFAQWQDSVREREALLPACPVCELSAPPGEIERWGSCVFCFQKKCK